MSRPCFKLKAFLLITFISFSAIFASCSANLPDIKVPEYTVIFDYDSDENLPEARLSVFVETVSDIRRCEELILQSEEELYKWETDEILKVESNNRIMAGNTSFMLPKNIKFPEGKYFLTYVDAAGEEVLQSFNVKYDQNIYEMTTKDLSEYIKQENFQKKIAIYDEEDTLIYFGESNGDTSSDERIKRAYRSAAYYYIIWNKRNNTVMCIFPRKTLDKTEE